MVNMVNIMNNMNIQEPKTFQDILKLQAILDKNISSIRERTLEDIKLSLIAELIEFNEETKDSHKTWKTKSYNKENELEELTDIYFFFAQLLNYMKHIHIEKEYINDLIQKLENGYIDETINDSSFTLFIVFIINNKLEEFISCLNSFKIGYGYTKQDILKTYWAKWQKNMERIGKEWN